MEMCSRVEKLVKVIIGAALLVSGELWCNAENTYLISFHKPDAVVIVNEEGKVLWKAQEKINHPQECTVLESGDILCSEYPGVVALGLDQKVKWRHKNPEGTENPIAEQIGPDRYLIAVEGPTQLHEINSRRDVLKIIQLSTTATDKVHAQIRGARKTPQGTYLVAFYREGAVREYNANGEVVRDFGSYKGAIGIVRLENGNTLVSGSDVIKEIDSSDNTVWEYSLKRNTKYKKATLGGIVKLKNGNIVSKLYTANKKNPTLIEISPDKKVVREIRVKGYAKSGAFQILSKDFKPSRDVAAR